MNLITSAKSARPLALVTGASSGIGADLARELACDGYDLVLVARREAPMLSLVDELLACQVDVTVIAANLGVIDAAARLIGELARRGLSELDVLVNDAGFGDYASFVKAEPTKLSEMIQLNVVALTELTRAFLPGMVARGRGRVLLVGGMAGFAPGPGAAVFHASKAYVLSLGEALDHELRGTGVAVTTLCPGQARTGCQKAAGESDEVSLPQLVDVMRPADVARQAYLALRAGRRVVVPGLLNKLRALWLRLAPHELIFAVAENPRLDERDLQQDPLVDTWNIAGLREVGKRNSREK